MKPQLSWQMAIVTCVGMLVLGGLAYKGLVPVAILAGFFGGSMLPSPLKWEKTDA
jgi:hypothetical protein